jgi:hypothetical protein
MVVFATDVAPSGCLRSMHPNQEKAMEARPIRKFQELWRRMSLEPGMPYAEYPFPANRRSRPLD